MTSSGEPRIGGWCDPRFAAVREAFAANFAERGETGAAACLVLRGTVVADLWGGRAGPGPGRGAGSRGPHGLAGFAGGSVLVRCSRSSARCGSPARRGSAGSRCVFWPDS